MVVAFEAVELVPTIAREAYRYGQNTSGAG